MSKKFPHLVNVTESLQLELPNGWSPDDLFDAVRVGFARITELEKWCTTLWGKGGEKGRWRNCGYEFSFRHQADAAMFRLRVPSSTQTPTVYSSLF